MENNSAAVECLIRFYINTKHVLKTKQLIERGFMDELVKHCKKCRFDTYTTEEIKKTWKNLVAKYKDLKNKGTIEDKINWKYFEILDSCYEPTDFHNVLYPKFSEEMVWFLIECFLKRKALRKTEKHSVIVADIHREFLQCGYLYITKQDIENKWKHLNKKYEKLKDDNENFQKLPYLQALQGFHEENSQYIAKMIFTKELTEILIERFTEKKIKCVIHGYDNEEVLGEIQSEFKDLGFYFSKEDIKEKWRKLSNIFKFLMTTGNNMDTSWIHFDAMKNHYKDDFVFPWSTENPKMSKRNTPRRIRGRSKSVGLERGQNSNTYINVKLEKPIMPPETELINEKYQTISLKRLSELRGRSKSPKKLKTSSRTTQEDKITRIIDFNENSRVVPTNGEFTVNTQNRGNTIAEGEPTGQVHVININHSDIDQRNGNLTINLPSITKKFSDNELPLKKRLRTEDDNSDMLPHATNEMNSFDSFPVTDYTESRKFSTHFGDDKRVTQEEMKDIMDKINRENTYNNVVNEELNNISDYKDEELKYTNVYDNFNSRCLLIPKKECRDNPPMHNYSTNTIPQQPSVLLVVIKVDGSNNSSNGMPNERFNMHGAVNSLQNSHCVIKQENFNITTSISTDIINSTGETLATSNKIGGKVGPTCQNNNSLDADTCNFDGKVNNRLGCEQFITHNRHSSGDCSHHIENDGISDVCSVAENVTVYTTEDLQNEESVNEHKRSEVQKPDEVIFREPLAVTDKTDRFGKVKVANKTLNVNNKVNQAPQVPKSKTDKIRLPVTVGGKLKEIFISPQELNKLKLINFKTQSNIIKKLNETNSAKNTTIDPNFKLTPQGINSATDKNEYLGTGNFLQGKDVRNEDFDNESIFSEAVGEDGDLKDNLLATVIDFQEQNNQEFIEIKNLMKQNNLLQRETNRLLRLVLEKQ